MIPICLELDSWYNIHMLYNLILRTIIQNKYNIKNKSTNYKAKVKLGPNLV